MELGERQPVELVDAVVRVSAEYTVLRGKRMIDSALIVVFRGGLVKSERKLVFSGNVGGQIQGHQLGSGGRRTTDGHRSTCGWAVRRRQRCTPGQLWTSCECDHLAHSALAARV